MLWSLNYIVNIQKHALLVPVSFLGTSVRIGAGKPIPPFAITNMATAQKDEIIVFRGQEPFVQHPNVDITYNIIIDDSEKVIQGKQPVPLLNCIRGEVDRVLAETDAECRRIGFFP